MNSRDANEAKSWEQAVRSLMEDPERRQLVLDCYYDQPHAAAVERYRSSAEWRCIEAILPLEGGRALDVGAGHGITSYALSRSGWQVTALEPDPSSLVGAEAIRALAAGNRLNIEVVESEGELMPFDTGSFDLVFARQVLHHSNDLDGFCREVFRVLKPGGTFIAVRDHVISKDSDLPRFLEAHPLHRYYGGEHAYRLEVYEAALQNAGFQLEGVLAPFDSPINFGPMTDDDLRLAIAERVTRVPGASPLVRGLLRSRALLALSKKLLSRIDQRPGRLYSFVCRKTTGSKT